ncbi:hypothetical protein JW823_03660 [bacterium]|nr:hypothetical protein [candidate division CSSED10-310 bacterium]
MICRHLQPLEQALIDAGYRETCRGQVWSMNCREWVYYHVVLDIEALKALFRFDPCVSVHENTDPKSGLERGFECIECHDAVMGLISGAKRFPG